MAKQVLSFGGVDAPPPPPPVIDYEVVSKNTVKQLHDKFMAGLEAKAKKAIAPDVRNPNQMVDSIMELLMECTRKAIEIKADELQGMAKQGKEAVEKRTAEVKAKLHKQVGEDTSYPSPGF